MALHLFLLILLSGFLHACWNSLAKVVGKNPTILWLSMSLGGWLGIPYLFSIQDTIHWPTLMQWGAISGLAHSIYFLALTHAYERFSLSVIYPISRGVGIALTGLASVLLFKDPFSNLGLLGVLALVVGVGSFHYSKTHEPHGTRWGLLVGLTISLYLTIDYIALTHVSMNQLVFVIFIFMSLFLLPYLLITRRTALKETLNHKKSIAIGLGIISFSSYGLILLVFQSGALGYVVALRETSIIFAGIIAWIFLKEPFTKSKWLAIAFMMLGALLIKMS